jgi:hypothetical protein
MSTAVRSAALAAALCCIASVVCAHAPLARGLALAPNDSGAVAVRMPGFGWLLRNTASRDSAPSFAYACDALLGVKPIEEHVPMAYRHDGALLVGTGRGVRMLGSDGCPTGGVSLDAPIAALAVHAREPQRVFAATAGADLPPYVYRSDDGGESWTQGATLSGYGVSALVLDPSDPNKLYVSQTTAMQRSQIAVSSDGGATFEAFEQDRDLTLLYMQENPARLWATTRVVGKNVGVIILRAAGVKGPWQELLTVNFFGGFAVDPNDADVIWVGDEARGVFRSSDGGDSFEETQPQVASSCLAYGAGALWACTPGLPDETALLRSPDAIAMLEPIMAFADVDHLIDCSPAIDVEQVCAPAWVEWRRDILALPPLVPDAGVPDATVPAATRADAAIVPPARHASGCSIFAPRSATPAGWQTLCAMLGLLAFGARRSRLDRCRHMDRDRVARERENAPREMRLPGVRSPIASLCEARARLYCA